MSWDPVKWSDKETIDLIAEIFSTLDKVMVTDLVFKNDLFSRGKKTREAVDSKISVSRKDVELSKLSETEFVKKTKEHLEDRGSRVVRETKGTK